MNAVKRSLSGMRARLRSTNRATALKIAVILLALCLALFPLPSSWVERFYSSGIYPRLQLLLTPLSNFIPFAVADALLILLVAGLLVWWVARFRSAGRGRRLR
ncbi:MAG TPA: hypothetical protein VNO70_01760, partial [Blastocatellia bacterium]|nr:hypothetical protein [Blastocatellia bacterium]